MTDDSEFARLVSLACHDLRTPLATVHGFATTLERGGGLEPPADRYVEMINAASAQLAELIDELSLAARIESGRYDPTLREADTLELAQAAAARLGEERVRVTGSGAALETDAEAVERGLAALFQSALRHGGLDEVERGGGRRRDPALAGHAGLGPGRPRRGPARPRRGGRGAARQAPRRLRLGRRRDA